MQDDYCYATVTDRGTQFFIDDWRLRWLGGGWRLTMDLASDGFVYFRYDHR